VDHSVYGRSRMTYCCMLGPIHISRTAERRDSKFVCTMLTAESTAGHRGSGSGPRGLLLVASSHFTYCDAKPTSVMVSHKLKVCKRICLIILHMKLQTIVRRTTDSMYCTPPIWRAGHVTIIMCSARCMRHLHFIIMWSLSDGLTVRRHG